MKKLLTGEPFAGEPHARFGGRGRKPSSPLSGEILTGTPRKTFGGDNFWENDLSISEATTDEGRLHNVLAFERKSMIDTINTVQ